MESSGSSGVKNRLLHLPHAPPRTAYACGAVLADFKQQPDESHSSAWRGQATRSLGEWFRLWKIFYPPNMTVLSSMVQLDFNIDIYKYEFEVQTLVMGSD